MRAIDLFAGAGGFTTGASQAGARVLWAANHWREAVEVHASNHPGVVHLCQDLHQADWSQVPRHDLCLASPACQGFSRARGRGHGREGMMVDLVRSTAWAVVSCCEFHRPKFFVVENVREFLSWALYPAWKLAMEALGYRLTVNTLDASEFGVAQRRVRLFLVGSREGHEIIVRAPVGRRAVSGDVVDFGAGSWSPVNRPGRAERTLAQIERGRARLGRRFLIAYYGNSGSGVGLDEPIGTLTCVDRYAVIDDNRMRMLTVGEMREFMGFPSDYRLPARQRDAVKMLGNAVCPPVVREVVTQIKEAA